MCCVSLVACLSRHTSLLLNCPERRPYMPATVHLMLWGMAHSSATGAIRPSTILAHTGRDDSRQRTSLAWKPHHGLRTTPERDPGEAPQQPSGHDKTPTANLESCVVARYHPAAGADDYKLPRVLKAEHPPLPAIAAYSPAKVSMGEGCNWPFWAEGHHISTDHLLFFKIHWSSITHFHYISLHHPKPKVYIC